MAYPNRMICMSGTPTIMPKVTRSRESWRTSFSATALRRRIAEANLPGLLAAKFFRPRRDNEHVFEARAGMRDLRVDVVLLQQRAQLGFGILHVAIRQHAQSDTELRDAVDPGQFADEAR